MERVRWLRVIVTMATIAACVTYVHLSETSQHSVVLPSSVNFGTKQLGTSTMLPITISPASGVESSDFISAISEQAGGCPNFNIMTPGIPPGISVTSTCADGSGSAETGSDGSGSGSGSGSGCSSFDIRPYTFTATFSPTITGTQSCTLNLTINGGLQTITLVGTGQAPPIDVELETGGTASTTSRCTNCVLAFNKVNVGLTSAPKFTKVLNIGSGTATLNSVSASGVFAVTGNLTNRPLGPGGVPSETYSVTCSPQATGPTTGTLTINTNDMVTPNLTVMLKCEGIDSELIAEPGSIDMLARVHELSPPTSLKITNNGTANLTVNSLTPTTESAGAFQVTGIAPNDVIAPGQFKTAQVRFDATAIGDVDGNLHIVFDGTKTRDIPLVVKSQPTTLSLAPTGTGSTANLGVTCVGSTKRERFTLIANGPSDFKLEGIDKIVLGEDVFDVEPVTPATLPTTGSPATLIHDGGSTVEFDIAFSPRAAGVFNGGFTLDTDIPESPDPAEVPSSTVGLMAAGLPSGTNVTPVGPIDFGTVATGTSSATAQKITLTNCSSEPITITRGEILGDQDFKIMTAPDAEVPANGQVEYEIVLSPEFGGAKRAELEIERSDGLAKVVLIGNGDGPLAPIVDPDDLDPRDSYYACNAGGSGSLVVWLAVGGVIVLRRRRRAAHRCAG